MAGRIIIGYGLNSVQFSEFSGDELPGSTIGQASLEFSQNGLGYAQGPARTQRKIWAIATYATSAQVASLNTIFNAWDADRATSLNTAAVYIYDDLLRVATGNTSIPYVVTTAFFTTPPTVSLVGRSNEIFLLSFGLTEV